MSWPSRFGTLGEKVFGKDDPFNDKNYTAKNSFSSDEMPGVIHPLIPRTDPRYGKRFSSASAFRRITKEFGGEEIGTAYDNGYEPRNYKGEETSKRVDGSLRQRMKENLRLTSKEIRQKLPEGWRKLLDEQCKR